MKTTERDHQIEYPIILPRSNHSISRAFIDKDALTILYRLLRNGFKAYLVGGAVRDLLLGKKPKDFDVVTDAHPGQIKRLFRYHGHAYLIGRRFRLVHIQFKGGKIIEVSTFRKGVIPEGEGEEAAHNTTFGAPEEDVLRRDITINGLFYNIADFSVIDYVGGLADISNGLIRIIGNPDERYEEDPVRIWRVLRHAVRTNFVIEENTARAIVVHRSRLTSCPGARLFDELEKDMVSGTLKRLFELMNSYGILPYILGDVGRFFEKNSLAFNELIDLLDVVDSAIISGKALPQEVILSVLFWPWMKFMLAHMDKAVNKLEVLHTELYGSNMTIAIPRHQKASIVQIVTLLEKMLKALETFHMKGSLKKRVRYLDASLLCDIIINKKISGKEDPFRELFFQSLTRKRQSHASLDR